MCHQYADDTQLYISAPDKLKYCCGHLIPMSGGYKSLNGDLNSGKTKWLWVWDPSILQLTIFDAEWSYTVLISPPLQNLEVLLDS